jgi:serpin B
MSDCTYAIKGVAMPLKVYTIAVSILLGAALMSFLTPSAAAAIEKTELQEIYSSLSSFSESPVPVSGIRDNLSNWSSSGIGTKSEIIQQVKNQEPRTAFPDAAKREPTQDPIPTPTAGYSRINPGGNNNRLDKNGLMTPYSSQKAAMLGSLQNRQDNPTAIPVSGNGQKVVQANNQFALALYSRLVNEPGQAGNNLFFSPWSISTVMALTSEGARGDTASEIQAVFHFPGDDAARRSGFSEIISNLNRGESGYTLRTVNALWVERTFPILPQYTSTARNSYSAAVTNLDFIQSPEESRRTINTWVARQTADKIQDLLPAGSIHPGTQLVITNAIYFKGTWEKQFSPEKTVEEEFRVSPSQTIRVPLMRRTDEEAKYWYAETGTIQALRMPYTHRDGNELSMLVILPRDDGLEAVEEGLSAEYLSELRKALAYKRVLVYFPKFTLETTYSLPRTLSDMGMPTAFTPAADFSGMDGTGGLWIDDVIHKAFVDVNEEGTEAAAATAATMTMAYPGPFEPVPVFRADHPFIFLIQEENTGNILFMGRVCNPRAG